MADQIVIEIIITSTNDKTIQKDLRSADSNLKKNGIDVDLREAKGLESLDASTLMQGLVVGSMLIGMVAIPIVREGLVIAGQIKQLAKELAVLLGTEQRKANISVPGSETKVEIDGSMSEAEIAKRLSDTLEQKG